MAKVKEKPLKKKKKVAKAFDPDLETLGYSASDLDEELPKKKKRKKVMEEDVSGDLPKKKKLTSEQKKKKELKKLSKAKDTLKTAQKLVEAYTPKQGRKHVSKTDTKKLSSIVGDHAEEIHQTLEDNDIDNATMMIRKRMLQAMVDVIPFIEDNIRSSNGARGSYHLKSLYECINSILGELGNLKDREAIARNYITDMLQPFAAGIANAIIMELNNIITDLRPLIRDDAKQELNQALNASRTRMGTALSSQYTELRNGTLQFLQDKI